MEIKNIKIENLKIAKYNPRLDLQPEDKEYYIDDKGILRSRMGNHKGEKAYIGTCKKCGKRFISHQKRLNCSRSCAMSFPRPYMKDINKSKEARERIGERNKDPEFRKKVSEGLKKRKQRLGKDYHSEATKAKIGKATKERWYLYKDKMTKVLIENGIKLRRRENYIYNTEWKRMRKKILDKIPFCILCGEIKNLNIHHIIPYDVSGDNNYNNLIPLCSKHHRIVEYYSWKMFEALGDWNIVKYILMQKFKYYMGVITWKLKQLKLEN